MTRLLIIFALIVSNAITAYADSRCIPFFRNYSANDYNAHNRNYDIVSDEYGNIFVANFEGLLYYDGVTWRKIHTPGISRVTCVAKDKNGKIWVGGFNIFGYLTADKHGRLKLQPLVSDLDKNGIGEVSYIKASGKDVYVYTTHGKTFRLDGKKLRQISITEQKINSIRDSVTNLNLPSGCKVSYTRKDGLQFSQVTSKWGTSQWSSLSEKDGLISNNINYLTYDGDHSIMGATDNGLFVVEAMSPYGQITAKQGLKGEVNCINSLSNTLYVGTMEGLFKIDDTNVVKIANSEMTCWQMINNDNKQILCATTFGVYSITAAGTKQMNSNHTLSLCMGQGTQEFYTGEVDGIYHNNFAGGHKLIANIEKVTKITLDQDNLLAETIFGQLWQISLTTGKKKCLRKKADPNIPKVEMTDAFGSTWKTDGEGFNLSMVSHNQYNSHLKRWINPFSKLKTNALFITNDGEIWIGGGFGLIRLDGRQIEDKKIKNMQAPFIREIISLGDSVIWGGFGPDMKPVTNITNIKLPSNCHRIILRFSSQGRAYILPTRYRYRINGGRWTPWSEDNDVEFNNVSSGKTKVEMEAQNLFGQTSGISTVVWDVEYPIYQRWYANLFYLILLVGAIVQFMQWRTRKLNRDKERLEKQVSERTSELSNALYDLKKTQKKLVRMERTATAGKLTQGLIDRILNPINYINNFSKLTSGLAKDLKEDIDDEKENMSEDNYEDCEDILGMMTQNLQKIEEHGTNTTRTLRAMEAILNNQIGTRTDHDIVTLCHQTTEAAKEHHAKEIAECNINVSFESDNSPIIVSIDHEAISRVLISLISNSVYYVAKKFHQSPYAPQITITAKAAENDNEHKAIITIRDNGNGIDENIKDKIFDPFFTTKTTGEASGVGLYLVRELIQEHNGTIEVDSKKGEYFQMTITL